MTPPTRFFGETLVLAAFFLPPTILAASPKVTYYRMQTPRPSTNPIEQASDLCYGRIAGREGLWTACDRNGGRTGGRIYRFSNATLASAPPGGTLIADEEIVIRAPHRGWPDFRHKHRDLGPEVLDHLQERIAAGQVSERRADQSTSTARPLDLEAITIGVSCLPPHEPRLFVVAEEPYSIILELELGRPGKPTYAELTAAYRYDELEDEHGTDSNDGLESLAYAGVPGQFWWAEEGTCPHKPDAHPRLFFGNSRLGLCRLKDCRLQPEASISKTLTEAVRTHLTGESQTLNALCLTGDGHLLALDRNGGWVLWIDPRQHALSKWFNVYDIAGINLREVLADFPGRRVMPYVSFEGIALDEQGALWLVDDPAMPESFRDSCLVRITGLPPVDTNSMIRVAVDSPAPK